MNSLTEMAIGRWLIAFDREETKNLYARLHEGASDNCGCPGCENYQKARVRSLEPEFVRLLYALGADPLKELSVRRVAPLDAKNCLYAGSFAVWGRVVNPPPDDQSEGVRVDVFEPLGEFTHIALRTWKRPPSALGTAPLIRLRFLMVLPWLGEGVSAPVDLTACRGPADKTDS